MRGMQDRPRLVLLACVGVGLLAGCGGTSFQVQQYPPFYTPDLKTAAVAPFDNRTPQVGAGGIVAEGLAGHLALNGTYTVVGPRAVRALLGEEGWTGVPTRREAALLTTLKETGAADALIVGRVLAYGALQTTYVDYEHPDLRLDHGDRHGRWGWSFVVPDVRYVSRTHVAVEASMIRVADGSVIHATPVPVQATVEVESGWPAVPETLIREAVDEAVGGLVEEFAIVPVTLRVHSHKALRTAAGREGGTWDYEKSFRASDEQMVVVLRLPRAADRNPFRLIITPKGEKGTVVASAAFVWSREHEHRGFVFSPRKIAAAAGPGKYRVNVYADCERVMRHTFRIKD